VVAEQPGLERLEQQQADGMSITTILRTCVKQWGHRLVLAVSRFHADRNWRSADIDNVMYVYGRRANPDLYTFRRPRESKKTPTS